MAVSSETYVIAFIKNFYGQHISGIIWREIVVVLMYYLYHGSPFDLYDTCYINQMSMCLLKNMPTQGWKCIGRIMIWVLHFIIEVTIQNPFFLLNHNSKWPKWHFQITWHIKHLHSERVPKAIHSIYQIKVSGQCSQQLPVLVPGSTNV